jgi:hypothetical protein
MKYVEDVMWAVLIVWLIPVFIVLGCVAVGVFLVRRTYWWMLGDSTLSANRDGRMRDPHAVSP